MELYLGVVEEFFKIAAEDKITIQTNIIPNSGKIIGVRSSVVKKYAKELLKKYQYDVLMTEFPDHQYYEIDLLKGFFIAYAKMSNDDRINEIEKFSTKITNWAICDTMVCATRFKPDSYDDIFNLCQKLTSEEEEFVVRVGLVLLLKYFSNSDKLAEIGSILEKLSYEKYYVLMGAAWLISSIFVYQPEAVYQLLSTSKLPSQELIYKSIQKIIDSYRVSPEWKERLKTLRSEIRTKAVC